MTLEAFPFYTFLSVKRVLQKSSQLCFFYLFFYFFTDFIGHAISDCLILKQIIILTLTLT